jgi:hypothetical protein
LAHFIKNYTIENWGIVIQKIGKHEKLIRSSTAVKYYLIDKIVQRFYETRLCRSVWRKAKIPIPSAPKTGFPLRFNTLLGYFGIFTTAHRAVVPHFRFKKDLILYLNSSRAASSREFKFKN